MINISYFLYRGQKNIILEKRNKTNKLNTANSRKPWQCTCEAQSIMKIDFKKQEKNEPSLIENDNAFLSVYSSSKDQ